jgi:hypothetical protein
MLALAHAIRRSSDRGGDVDRLLNMLADSAERVGKLALEMDKPITPETRHLMTSWPHEVGSFRTSASIVAQECDD